MRYLVSLRCAQEWRDRLPGLCLRVRTEPQKSQHGTGQDRAVWACLGGCSKKAHDRNPGPPSSGYESGLSEESSPRENTGNKGTAALEGQIRRHNECRGEVKAASRVASSWLSVWQDQSRHLLGTVARPSWTSWSRISASRRPRLSLRRVGRSLCEHCSFSHFTRLEIPMRKAMCWPMMFKMWENRGSR